MEVIRESYTESIRVGHGKEGETEKINICDIEILGVKHLTFVTNLINGTYCNNLSVKRDYN